MKIALTNKINNSVVRIQYNSKHGTGFFVTKNLIVTCHHNLDDNNIDIRNLKVFVNDTSIKINQIYYVKLSSNPDIVLLETLDFKGTALPIEKTKSADSQIYTYGFQFEENEYKGYPVFGTLGGTAKWGERENYQEFLVIQRDANISFEGGLSGAPVFSIEQNRVVGIVKKKRDEGDGFAIPIERIKEIKSDVLTQNISECYSEWDFFNLKNEYYTILKRQYSTMRFGNKDIDIKDTYVTLTFSSVNLSGNDSELNVKSSKYLNNQLNARIDLGRPHPIYINEEVILQRILNEKKVIIIGEPGIGKTTLFKNIITKIVNQELNLNKIPVFVKATDFNGKIANFDDYISTKYRQFEIELKKCVESGEAIIFLDGLDEVSLKIQRQIIDLIERLYLCSNQIFLSCRIAAFQKRLFNSEYTVYECIGFNKTQQKKFINTWFKKDYDKIKTFIRLTNNINSYKHFLGNPLLLTLLVTIFEQKSQIPHRRAEIYKEFIDIFLELRGESHDEYPSIEGRIELYKELSTDLFLKGLETFGKNKFHKIVEDYQTKHPHRSISSYSTETITDLILANDGIITKHNDAEFKFYHLTFQEYFTSLNIRDNSTLHPILFKNILNPRWEEVIRLTISVESPTHAKKLLTTIWTPEIKDNHLFERLFLAARCVTETTSVDEKYLEHLTDNLIKIDDKHSPELLVNKMILHLSNLAHLFCPTLNTVIEYFKNNNEIFKLVDFLKYSNNPKAFNELCILYDHILGNNKYINEQQTILSGTLINSLGYYNFKDSFHFWYENLVKNLDLLYAPFVNKHYFIDIKKGNDKNYLTESGYSFLAHNYINSIDVYKGEDWITANFGTIIAKHYSEWIAYLIIKLENPEINLQVLKAGLEGKNRYKILLVARQVMNLQNIELSNSIESLKNSIHNDFEKVMLLDILNQYDFLFSCPQLLNIIYNKQHERALILKAMFFIVRDHSEYIDDVIVHCFSDSDDDELKLGLLKVLREHNIEIKNESIIFVDIDIKNRRIIYGILHYLTDVPNSISMNWILDVLNCFKKDDTIYLKAIYCLSKTCPDVAFKYIKKNVTLSKIKDIPTKTIIIKSLGAIGTKEAIDMLKESILAEDNHVITSNIIDILGTIRNEAANNILIMCIDKKKWPLKWEKSDETIKKGVQKIRDKRRLSAIHAINNNYIIEALPCIETIVKNICEPNEIRDIALETYQNLKWHLKLQEEYNSPESKWLNLILRWWRKIRFRTLEPQNVLLLIHSYL